MMKKQKTVSILLAAAFAFSPVLTACKTENGGTGKATVWTATSSIKIKQEDDYSEMYGNTTLSFAAFKNENESAQVLFNPALDIRSFDLTLADLTDGQGNVLPKESFSLYGQKYIKVEKITDPKTQTGAGMYPDALVPLANLIAEKENVCEAGNNQGIWVKLKPSKEQAAGVYTGTFLLKLDSATYQIPVKAEVFDYVLSDEKHTKQDFGCGWDNVAGMECDSTIEMQETYYEFFQDYRIDLGNLPGMGNNYEPKSETVETELDAYIERVAEATLDERVGTVRLPYVHASAVDENGETVQCISLTQMRALLSRMMEYAIENNINVFQKVHTYFMFLDEDTLRGDVADCNYTLRTTAELYQTMEQEYRSEWSKQGELSDFQEEVLSDLKNIPNLCVGMMVDTMTAGCTYVPLLTYLTSDETIEAYYDWQNDFYDEGYAELWTYTCENPKIPNPTYHIEDTALSARMFSWMMYEYNIVGNLLWQAALGGERGGTNGSVQKGFFQDQYGVANKFVRVNGDGFLAYPGREYGVYGPVASVRLEQILEGNEDFELLYALEQDHIQRANEKGVTYDGEDFDGVLNMLTKELYSGITYNYTEDYIEIFEQSRRTLNNLLLMAKNCGALIEKVTTNKGVVTAVVSAPKETQISLDGVLKTGTEANGIVTYTFEIPLVNDENRLCMTAKRGENEYTLDFDFGAKLQDVSFVEGFEKGTFPIELAEGSVTVQTDTQGDKGVELLYNVTQENEDLKGHTAVLDLSSLKIDHTQKYITFTIVAEQDVTVAIAGKGARGVYITAGEVQLKAGENEVKIELSEFSLKKDGNLTLLRLRLAENTPPDHTYKLTLRSMLVGG